MGTRLFPEKINDFKIYANDSKDLTGIADVELPALNSKTEEIDGAGIAGSYEAATFGHFESMQFKINWRMITDEIAQFLKPDSIKVDCRVVNQEYDNIGKSYRFIPNRIVIEGHVTKNELGKVSKGGLYEGSSEVEVTYFKLMRDGKTLIEIDKRNYKYVIDGVDYMKPIRKALGME